MKLQAVGGEVRAAVGKDEGPGCPGVGGAHVEGVGGGEADVPGGIQIVQTHVLVDGLSAVGVVFAEGLVHMAVEDDGLRRRGCCCLAQLLRLEQLLGVCF